MKTRTKRITQHSACTHLFLLVCCYICSAIIALIIYLAGGTDYAYTNLMYLPITLVAVTRGKIHGMIHACVSGLMIGPFMPLNHTLQVTQYPGNWLMRLAIYVMVAFVIGYLADYYKANFEQNLRRERMLQKAQSATLFSLVKLLESRDVTSGAHVERVSSSCKLLAEELQRLPNFQKQVDSAYIENLYEACPLHDIGKVGIPDDILLKPGKLTDEEFEVMKKHTVIGAETLLKIQHKYPGNKFLQMGIALTRSHHEKWDGSGYPDGIAGDAIPLSARIVALTDVYDALRSKRPYKPGYSHEKAVEIIKQERGLHFDPVITDVFLVHGKLFQTLYDQFNEEGEVPLQ
ncbi:HD-GYP domain-containing protein [Sporolactobacillus nakayamae]|uniref:HD domain-containing protein n=1 Tax=Sporolactobacillus nakayamae TaxID=269670 RepID=A0A1I2PNL9_9BACL|nr:HD domain-containing phosphohydrolase [Sporolactobacillus nakayamae]SFG17160.1 HD domain-containing protein [Sporolactobacillus nakayamae]